MHGYHPSQHHHLHPHSLPFPSAGWSERPAYPRRNPARPARPHFEPETGPHGHPTSYAHRPPLPLPLPVYHHSSAAHPAAQLRRPHADPSFAPSAFRSAAAPPREEVYARGPPPRPAPQPYAAKPLPWGAAVTPVAPSRQHPRFARAAHMEAPKAAYELQATMSDPLEAAPLWVGPSSPPSPARTVDPGSSGSMRGSASVGSADEGASVAWARSPSSSPSPASRRSSLDASSAPFSMPAAPPAAPAPVPFKLDTESLFTSRTTGQQFFFLANCVNAQRAPVVRAEAAADASPVAAAAPEPPYATPAFPADGAALALSALSALLSGFELS